jgi:hypothetical protein
MKTVKISILMLAIIAFTASSSFAAGLCDSNDPVNGDEQACTDLGGTYGPGNSTPGDVGGGPGAPSGVPLDGGVSLLVFAGVGYGVKQLRARKAAIAAFKA